MSYRVEYSGNSGLEKQTGGSGGRRFLLRGMFFVLFLLLVNGFWQRGREVLMQLIFPGDWDAARDAVAAFANNLHSGLPLRFAIESFCQEIVQRGY